MTMTICNLVYTQSEKVENWNVCISSKNFFLAIFGNIDGCIYDLGLEND